MELTREFAAARQTLGIEGNVFGLVAPGAAAWSRKQIDELVEKGKAAGAKAVYTVKVAAEGNTSGLEKTLGVEGVKSVVAAAGAKPGDLVIAVAAKQEMRRTEAAALVAGQLRLFVAEKLGLIPGSGQTGGAQTGGAKAANAPTVGAGAAGAQTGLSVLPKAWELCWITGFPLFDWSETDKAWVSAQHPFTGVVEEDLELLDVPERWGEIRSKGYDLVLNGYELGSGSVRIHRQDVQARVFRALGLTDEQARQRFGFFLDALTYGTPPHGGIALGIDRVAMLLAGEKSLREVIAFPKTAKAQDLMADSPSPVDSAQLRELGIEIKDRR